MSIQSVILSEPSVPLLAPIRSEVDKNARDLSWQSIAEQIHSEAPSWQEIPFLEGQENADPGENQTLSVPNYRYK